MDKTVYKKKIRLITWLGVIVNLLLAFVKFIVGILGSSQAVIADALHSLSDLSTDFALLIGVRYWSAPPDKRHPYGHRKIESLITTAVGLVLGGTALTIAFESVSALGADHESQTQLFAISGPVLSLILKEILYQFTIKTGKKVKSSALVANAWHHRSDALSSIPALIAVLLASLNPALAFVDQIGAFLISIIILKVSWEIIKPALHELTDSAISPAELEKVKKIAMMVEGVREVHAIRSRKASSMVILDLHVLVDPHLTVKTGHDIASEVKYTLINSDELDIIDVVVHLEPYENKEEKVSD